MKHKFEITRGQLEWIELFIPEELWSENGMLTKWKWNVKSFRKLIYQAFGVKFQSVEKKIAFRRYVGDQQRYQNHTIAALWKLELYLPRRQ